LPEDQELSESIRVMKRIPRISSRVLGDIELIQSRGNIFSGGFQKHCCVRDTDTVRHGTDGVEKKFLVERGNFVFERREAVRLMSWSELC
jgi:hypothetical protein